MGFFASSTTPENRGRTGGITFFAIGLSFFILGNLGVGSVGMASIVLAGIRLTGLILFFLLEPKEEPPLEQGRSTYKEVIRNRSFLLYFVPWIMFNIVDYLTISVINNLFTVDFIRLSSVFESSLIAVLAIVTGFLIDMKGRKRLAIFGFAFLGIGYGFLGLSPDITGWMFYTIANGIAWGILNVTFLFTLWGDIAQGRDNEKFYVMGALPYLFSTLMYLLADPIMRGIDITKVFTFACIFLFLAVLPLIFAPETLSEKVMKDLELKTYLQKAQKIAAKTQEKGEKEEEDSSVEFAVAQEEEEAEERAEECY